MTEHEAKTAFDYTIDMKGALTAIAGGLAIILEEKAEEKRLAAETIRGGIHPAARAPEAQKEKARAAKYLGQALLCSTGAHALRHTIPWGKLAFLLAELLREQDAELKGISNGE